MCAIASRLSYACFVRMIWINAIVCDQCWGLISKSWCFFHWFCVGMQVAGLYAIDAMLFVEYWIGALVLVWYEDDSDVVDVVCEFGGECSCVNELRRMLWGRLQSWLRLLLQLVLWRSGCWLTRWRAILLLRSFLCESKSNSGCCSECYWSTLICSSPWKDWCCILCDWLSWSVLELCVLLGGKCDAICSLLRFAIHEWLLRETSNPLVSFWRKRKNVYSIREQMHVTQVRLWPWLQCGTCCVLMFEIVDSISVFFRWRY